MAKRAKFGNTEFDVVYSEEVSRSSTITDKPVEEGEDISDHIKHNPISFSISGICTFPNAAKKIQQLTAYWTNKKVLTYVGRNVFNDMVIESFKSTHDNSNSGGFNFTMTLRQVRVANKKTIKVSLPKGSTQASSKSNKGKKQSQKAEKKQTPLDKVKALNYSNKVKG